MYVCVCWDEMLCFIDVYIRMLDEYIPGRVSIFPVFMIS